MSAEYAKTVRITETRLTWDRDPSIAVIVSERGPGVWQVSSFYRLPVKDERPLEVTDLFARNFPTIEAAQAAGARLLDAMIEAELAYREAAHRAEAAFRGLDLGPTRPQERGTDRE